MSTTTDFRVGDPVVIVRCARHAFRTLNGHTGTFVRESTSPKGFLRILVTKNGKTYGFLPCCVQPRVFVIEEHPL